MNFSEEFKAVNDKIEKINFEIKAVTLGTGQYKDIPDDKVEKVLAHLNSQLTKLEADKEWFKKRTEEQVKKRCISTAKCLISDSSSTVISKETYIQKIQELLPGVKLSDSVYRLLKYNSKLRIR